MRVSALRVSAIALLTLGVVSAFAAAGGVAAGIVFVPWKLLNIGDAAPAGMLVLYWIPFSRDDFRRSELLTYRPLTEYPPQCVAMSVVQADDEATIARLGVEGKLPIAVLADESGHVLATAENEHGFLRAAAVDKLLRDAVSAREVALNQALDDAPKKLGAGDRNAAVALYRGVWEQRCLFPRHAKEAEHALKKLGVPLVAAKE